MGPYDNIPDGQPMDDEEEIVQTAPIVPVPARIEAATVKPIAESPVIDIPQVPLSSPSPAAPVAEDDISNIPDGEPMDDVQEVAESEEIPDGEPLDEGVEPGTKQAIAQSPEDYDKVRRYMIERLGYQWADRPAEEVVDGFVTHMRYFGANDFTTLGELRYNISADDKQKVIINDAYSVYDKLNSFLTNDGTSGAIGGIVDYGVATLLSPSTYLGGLVGGKVVTKGTAQAAKMAINNVAKQALVTGGKESALKIIKASASQQALKAAAVATLVDIPTNVAMDYMYQSAKMESGFQEDYSLTEAGIAATASLVGGAIGAAPHITRGLTGLSGASETISQTKAARKAASRGVAGPKVAEAVAQNVNKLTKSMKDWAEVVRSGQVTNPNMLDMSESTKWFFDKNDPNSIFRIIHDSGADLDLSDDVRFTDQLLDYARNLPEEDLANINEALKPMGLTFGETLDVIGAIQNSAGVDLNQAKQAKQYAKGVFAASVKKQQVNGVIVGLSPDLTDQTEAAASPQTAKYVASLWRRILVSHPATTAVNIQGWGQAFAMDTMAEIIHGGTLGSAGLAGKIFGQDWGGKYLAQSKALMQNQVYKARMMLDPYATIEGWDALIANAPKKIKKSIEQNMFGGVQEKGAPELFGINPNNKAVKGAEWAADKAAKLTLIKAQDVFTKTYSGMAELDKLSRLNYGKGLDQLVNEGNYHLITPEMWQGAVNDMLKQTMSADYTKGTGALNSLARMVEGLSNAPYIGFLFPFGRFMNNNIAFAIEHSPLGLISIGSDMYKNKGKAFNYTLMEKTSKVMAGSLALATLFSYAKDHQDDGLQWYESEQSDGTVLNRQNQAPGALFRLAGRMSMLISEGEGVPPELWDELKNQLGYGNISRQIENGNALSDVVDYLSSPDSANKADLEAFIGFAGQQMAKIAVGFTRPIEPFNRMLGAETGSDVQIDRKQASTASEKISQELTRYTGAFFAPFFGNGKTEEGVPTMGIPARSATGPKGDIRDPNPTSGLFGLKEEHTKLPINILLGKVNIPPFTLESRTASPEFDAFRDTTILPILNAKAKALMDGPLFNRLPQYQKVAEVNKIVNEAQEEILKDIDAGYLGSVDEQTYNERRKWSSLPESDRISAKNEYGITKDDNDLSLGEIQVLKEYIKQKNEFYKFLRQ